LPESFPKIPIKTNSQGKKGEQFLYAKKLFFTPKLFVNRFFGVKLFGVENVLTKKNNHNYGRDAFCRSIAGSIFSAKN